MKISEKDFIGVYGICKICGNDVYDYTCNKDLILQRREGCEWDWWVSCSNETCRNHYGEGIFQNDPEWIIHD